MLAIILSACLSTDPSVCKDYSIPVTEVSDPVRCAMFAPQHFVAWAEEHPGWQIKRWKCGAAG